MSCFIVLKEKGMRLTPQRRLILDVIHDTQTHLTAEEIMNYVNARVPGVNKSTVYRTLEILEEAGCVVKSEIGDRFVYHHTEEGHHHHLVCHICGKSMECAESVLLPVEQAIYQRYGFQANLKHLVISGLCQECQSRGK